MTTLVHGNSARARELVGQLGLEEGRKQARQWPTLEGTLSSMSGIVRLPPIGVGGHDHQMLRMSDGGTVHLAWCRSRAAAASSRGAVLICPGLNNTSRWAYIKHTMQNLARLGFVAVCFDYRGYCAPLTSPKVGSADSWRDLPEVIAAIQRECAAPAHSSAPPVPLFAIGFSAGGTLLAKYLSDAGASTPLCAAVTISSPFNLCALFDYLSSSLPMRALASAIASAAKLTFVRHANSAALKHRLDWWKVGTSTGMRELELATIIPLHGNYADPEEYHRECSPEVGKIGVPLLCIHAADDPLVPASALPLDELRANERCLLVLTRRGGHLGWAGKWKGTFVAPTWVDELCARFVLSQLPERQRAPPPPRARL